MCIKLVFDSCLKNSGLVACDLGGLHADTRILAIDLKVAGVVCVAKPQYFGRSQPHEVRFGHE